MQDFQAKQLTCKPNDQLAILECICTFDYTKLFFPVVSTLDSGNALHQNSLFIYGYSSIT